MMDFLLNHAYSFYFGFAAFLIFFVLLAKFGIGPIVTAIDARDAKIAHDLKESESTYQKAQQLKQQLDAQLRNAETKIGEMMAEARRDAESHKARTIEQSRGELEAMRGRALREIEAARQAAVLNLRTEVAEVATTVAEKILREQLDPRRHDQLVANAIDAFEKGAAGAGRS